MKRINIKITAIILVIIIMGLITIPQFKIKIAGETYEYPNVDLSVLTDNDSTVGNVRQGSGIFAENKVVATLENGNQENLDKLFDVVTNRIDYAGLYDVRVNKEVNNTEYSLIFFFPSHYETPDQYAIWLTTEGKIAFTIIDNSGGTQEVDISDKDITGKLKVEYDNNLRVTEAGGSVQLGNHLVFGVNDRVEELLLVYLNASSNTLLTMFVDDAQSYYLIPRNIELNEIQDVRAVPATEFTSKYTKVDYLNITKTYFLTEPVDVAVDVSDPVEAVAPMYAPEGGSLIGVMFIIAAAAIALYVYTRLKLRGLVAFTILVSFTILLSVLLIKIAAAYISIGTAIGFILILGLSSVIFINILKNASLENYLIETNKLVSFGIIIAFIGIILLKFTLNLGIFTDLISTFILLGLSISVTAFFILKPVVKYYLNEN